MNTLSDILWIELRKAHRSRMPLFTAIGYMFMPLACAFMIFIYKNPDLSRKLGLVSAKANLIVTGTDWAAYLKLFTMAATIGGFFLFCLIISWVYGREFTDRTLKDLLAVPVSRASIVLAKLVVAMLWSLALVALIFIAALALGAALHLEAGTLAVISRGAAILAACILLQLVATVPFAFFASAGRGYPLPMGLAILAMILANIIAVTGWGEYFPWAIPGLLSQGEGLAPVSIAIVLATGLAGLAATYLWWMLADQSR